MGMQGSQVMKVSCFTSFYLSKLLVELGAVGSRASALRLIKQGAVEIDGEKCYDDKWRYYDTMS